MPNRQYQWQNHEVNIVENYASDFEQTFGASCTSNIKFKCPSLRLLIVFLPVALLHKTPQQPAQSSCPNIQKNRHHKEKNLKDDDVQHCYI